MGLPSLRHLAWARSRRAIYRSFGPAGWYRTGGRGII